MSLSKYRKMRDFSETSEPSGKSRRQVGNSYVIQKHDASHLHYDFRLELGGVLLSWAVPKGPTLDPSVKRLAVQTEDHPVEYGGFEGTIPEGAYGGGTVMIWDRGTWQSEGDAQAAYQKGHLKFQLHGQKLTGAWHLVRTQRGAAKQKQWLLFKAHDEAARPGDSSLVDTETKSALSGRDLQEITAGRAPAKKASRVTKKAAVRTRKAAPAAEKASSKSAKKAAKLAGFEIEGARRAALPDTVEPELAALVSETPTQENFVHEVKFDGYRVIARVQEGRVQLFTRNAEDWTERMPSLRAALGKLKVKGAILDGEFVALDDKGLSDFQLLQNSFSGKVQAPLAYYAFDLLYLDGFDLRPAPLLARKAKLQELLKALPKSAADILRYSDHVLGNGAEFFAQAAKLGLEGVVSKRADSSYRAGRGKDWQKSKSLARQEFVIVGYSDPGGSRAHLGALLLGVRKGGSLVYSGKVGTGFNDRSLKDVHDKLAPLEVEQAKLENAPRGADIRGVHWVKPELVAEVAYTGITHDGLLRHPVFKGLREDKPARDVVLEQPRAVASPRSVKKKPAAGRVPAALTHPDKVLYPELGLTKAELAAYYELVSERMLPHVVNRPLTLLRCPGGRSKHCFFQKHPGESLASGLVRVQAPSSDGSSEYAAIADVRGLTALVQMSALEVHIWGSVVPDADHPDQLVFDLDPAPELGFKEVVAGAHAMRDLLEEYGLKSWVKTTGGKGLHVTVPIQPREDWDTVKAFCRSLAEELVSRDPARYVATMSKAQRTGKIFIDYLRNGRGATFIAPYSTRAREGATIALPVEWDELTAKFKPDAFNVRNAKKLLTRRAADPFASMLTHQQSLPSAKSTPTRSKRR
jgi:bifunctional non-homologous end joining protein LigD